MAGKKGSLSKKNKLIEREVIENIEGYHKIESTLPETLVELLDLMMSDTTLLNTSDQNRIATFMEYFDGRGRDIMRNAFTLVNKNTIQLRNKNSVYIDDFHATMCVVMLMDYIYPLHHMIMYEIVLEVIEEHERMETDKCIEGFRETILNATDLADMIVRVNRIFYDTQHQLSKVRNMDGRPSYLLKALDDFASSSLVFLKNNIDFIQIKNKQPHTAFPAEKIDEKNKDSFKAIFKPEYQSHVSLFIDELKGLIPAMVNTNDEWIANLTDARVFYDLMKKHSIIGAKVTNAKAARAFAGKFKVSYDSFVKPTNPTEEKILIITEAINRAKSNIFK